MEADKYKYEEEIQRLREDLGKMESELTRQIQETRMMREMYDKIIQ